MNKTRLVKLGSVIFLSLVLLTPVVAAALTPPNLDGTGLPDLSNGAGIEGAVKFFIDLFLIFAGLLAVLFLIIGGFQYITSGASEELAETGKKTVQNSIIGLIIILLSYTIVNIIFRALAG